MHSFARAVLAAAVAAVLLSASADAAGVATASIDFGGEWMKVGLVKPGVPMEIVLNRESKRKTFSGVAIRNGERTFSSEAYNTAVKYPKNAYLYLLPLLGQKFDSPMVKEYQQRFPYYKLEADPDRGTVVFRIDEKTAYSVEELCAMIIQEGVFQAEIFAEQAISGIVVTVPPFFNQAQRRALLNAAELSGNKVLQLLNSNAAVAINYGVFRRKDINETEQNILFYDMGATSTTATIVGYKTAKDKSGITSPQLEIKSVGYDRTLGGIEFDLRLRDLLLKKASQKLKGDITSSPRSMAKLFKEAQRVKKILSANVETQTQIEGLFKDQDFRSMVTRAEFEEVCADLMERALQPIKDALEGASMKIKDLEDVIMAGGNQRIPKVQDLLTEFFEGRVLGKSINADEAAALGAAYQGAVLSQAFRVKKFVFKDASIFPLTVTFDREVLDDDGSFFTKTVTKTVFHRNNVLPQKKALSFNKVRDDLKFYVSYGDLSFLSEKELGYFGEQNITSVVLEGIAAALDAHADIEFKTIKAHFKLDESGLLQIDRSEVVFEAPPDPEPVPKAENKTEADAGKANEADKTADDAKAAGDEKTEKKKDDETKDETKDEAKEEKKDDDAKPAEDQEDTKDGDAGSEEQPTEEPEKEESSEEEEAKKDGNDKKEDEAAKESEKEDKKDGSDDKKKKKKEDKPKDPPPPPPPPAPKKVEEKLNVKSEILDIVNPSETSIKASTEKLDHWLSIERERRANEAAKNSLEAYIYITRDKLYEEVIEKVSTAEARDKLREDLSAASEWLDDEGWDSTASVYTEKLKGLNDTAKPIFERAAEFLGRPEAYERIAMAVNSSRQFLIKFANMTANKTEDEPVWITEIELTALDKLANDTEAWAKEQQEKQATTALTEEPVVKCSAVHAKAAKLERELVYLINKPRPRPKPKKKKIDLNGTTIDLNGTTINFNGTKIELNGTTIDLNGTDADTKPVDAPTDEAPAGADTDAGAEPKANEEPTEVPAADKPKEQAKTEENPHFEDL